MYVIEEFCFSIYYQICKKLTTGEVTLLIPLTIYYEYGKCLLSFYEKSQNRFSCECFSFTFVNLHQIVSPGALDFTRKNEII